MKILVTMKRVPDPALRPKFKGASLDLAGTSWVANPFDEYAIETALRMQENGANPKEKQGEIVLLSIGPKETETVIRKMLALGADRAILVDGADEALDSDSVARIVKAVVEKEKPDLLLMGKQAVDGDANQVGQIVAGLLGWPQATFAATIDVPADEKSLVVTREVDAGVETKKVPLPAVVTVDLRIVGSKSVKNTRTPASFEYRPDPRLPSVMNVMGAKKKPLQGMTMAELGVTAAPKVKTVSIEPPPPRKAGVKVADVNELVKKLAEEAKVI